MPVTHGVAGSSPVRTAKALGRVLLFFILKTYENHSICKLFILLHKKKQETHKTMLHMKNSMFTVVLFTVLSCNLDAQTTFQKIIRGNGATSGVDIIIGNNNDYYIVGNTSVNDTSCIFISNISAAGTIIWSKTFSGSFHMESKRLIKLTDGFLIIGTARFISDIEKGLVVKTDGAGNILWARTYESGHKLILHDGIYFGNNSLFIVGMNVSTLGADTNVYIANIDSMGQILFSKTYGSTGTDIAYSITKTSDNNVAIVGYSDIDDPFGDILVMKMNQSGNPLWTKLYDISINSYTNQIGFGICENHKQELVVCGSSKNYQFSPSNQAWGPVVLWIEGNGNLIRSTHYTINSGTCAAYMISELSNYDYFFTGKMGLQYGLAAKLDSSGTALWTQTYPDISGDMGKAKSNAIINENEFIIIGDYYGAIDSAAYLIKIKNDGTSGCNEHTPLKGSSSYPTTVSNTDFIMNSTGTSQLIQMYSSVSSMVDSTFCSDIINEIPEDNALSQNDYYLYPIPASSLVYIHQLDHIDEFYIFNIYGEVIKYGTQLPVEVAELKPGLYILQIFWNNHQRCFKFLKE
jgi:hypothetical protein